MSSSQTRDNTVVLVAFIAIALLVLVLVAKCGPNNSATASSPAPRVSHTSRSTTSPSTPGENTAQPSPRATVKPALLAKLQQQAQPVTRLYASFPDGHKAKATINRLRPLVTAGVIKDLQHQWVGGRIDPSLRVEVLKMHPFGYNVLDKNNVEVNTLVTQRTVYNGAPDDPHLLGVRVTFQKQHGHWAIVGIIDKPGN